MFKLDLEKAEEPEIKLLTSTGSLKKQESSRKTSTSTLLTIPKPLTVWITINCGKFFTKLVPHLRGTESSTCLGLDELPSLTAWVVPCLSLMGAPWGLL